MDYSLKYAAGQSFNGESVSAVLRQVADFLDADENREALGVNLGVNSDGDVYASLLFEQF